MFVINTNKMNTGYNEASVSGEYDIPMDGSTYTMFRSNGCIANCYINGVYGGWDGNNPNETSVLEYAKASNFDQDVTYPYNMLPNLFSCLGNGCSKDNYQFYTCFYFSNSSACHFLDFCIDQVGSVQHLDCGTRPAHMFERIVSRKVFEGGEVVGENINTFLKMKICQKNMCSRVGSEACGYTQWAALCPITYYVDLGLLHEDGTKTPIKTIEQESSYACMDENGAITYIDGDDTYDVIHGLTSQEGVVACKGDRLYFEFGNCPRCLLIDGYRVPKQTSSCAQYTGCANITFCQCCDHAYVYGSNVCDCIGCSTYAYHMCDSSRFNGIQFSIK